MKKKTPKKTSVTSSRSVKKTAVKRKTKAQIMANAFINGKQSKKPAIGRRAVVKAKAAPKKSNETPLMNFRPGREARKVLKAEAKRLTGGNMSRALKLAIKLLPKVKKDANLR